MPLSLKSATGSGSVPIGAVVMLPDFFENKVELDGAVYLRSGYVETDEAEFDTTFFNFPYIDKAVSTSGISYSGSQQYLNTAYLRSKYWVMGQKSGGGVGLFSSNDGLSFSDLNLTGGGSTVSINELKDSGSLILTNSSSTGASQAFYWTSSDGITFTPRLSPFWGVSNANGGSLTSLEYFSGYFYASGRTAVNTYDLKRSSDGINWTSTGKTNTGIFDYYPHSGGGKLLMVTPALSGTRSVETSTNGTTWNTVYTFPATDTVGILGYFNSKFVARVNRATTPAKTMVATSSDGVSWEFFDITNEPVNLATAYNVLRYYAGLYFATNLKENYISVSKDLKKWVERKITSLGNGIKPAIPAAGNNKLVFIDWQQYDYASITVENFSGTQYYAGADTFYSEGTLVQYMRIS